MSTEPNATPSPSLERDGPRSRAAVREMVVLHLVRRDVPAELIADEASFRADLAIDSLDLHALAAEIEDEFGVAFSRQDATSIATVGQLVDFIVTHPGDAG